LAETCYPVKVSHGHARQLVGKTRHLFMPTPVDMATPNPTERGYYCPMVQSNTFMIRAALGIGSRSVLNPSLRFKSDPDILALDIHEQMGGRLGVGKSQVRERCVTPWENSNNSWKRCTAAGRTSCEATARMSCWW